MSQSKRPMKKLTAAYLERAAVHYLGRFMSTEANLRNILRKKAQRRIPPDGDAPEELGQWIEAVVVKCRDYGYVNDEVYARTRVSALARRGWGARRIVRDLMFKGVAEEMAKDALSALQNEEGINDRSSALILARKRRLGPYRGKSLQQMEMGERAKIERREMGVLARAGLGLDVAKDLIHSEDAEELAVRWDVELDRL